MILNTISSKQQQFTGFVKFQCKPGEAKDLKNAINAYLPDSFVLSDKKAGNKKTYFILTGKHADKFLDFVGKMDFADIKEDIEKLINQKAKKLELKQLKKELKKGKLKI